MPALEIEVTIGTVSFNTDIDAPGPNMFLLTNTEQILDALATRRTDTPKEGEHGVQDSPSYYEARILQFHGELHATSQAERVAMEQQLDAAVALSRSQSFDGDDGYKLILITDEDGIEKQLYAKIIEMPSYRLIETGAPEDRTFDFSMYACDPAIYAQELQEGIGPESYTTTDFTFQDGDLPTFQDGDLPTFQDGLGSVMIVNNSGNFGSPPLIIITGPTENPVITNLATGKKHDFNRNGGVTLLADETLTINTASLTAIKTVSGVETNVRTKRTLDSTWFDIVPGENQITLFDDSGGTLEGQMAVDFRPSWI